jgi:small subunit ribosomal protein S4
MYGLSEKQFRLTYQKADRQKGVTGTNLLVLLERRLDSIVYRLGFVNSRSQGRQFVRHNHFTINGRKANVPLAAGEGGRCHRGQGKEPQGSGYQRFLEAVARRAFRSGWNWRKTASRAV